MCQQVIDQYADIGLGAARVPGVFFLHLQGGVDACQQALRPGLFITGGAVDLAGEEQALNELRLQCRPQVSRVEKVVFDSVTRPGDVSVFKPLDAAHQFMLHVERQAGGNAVGIDLVGVQPLRLDEDLVTGLVGKAHHLVLDRRTVARADTFDDAGVHWRAVEAAPNQRMGLFVGVRDVAGHLFGVLLAAAAKGKYRRRFVSRLRLQLGIINAAAVDTRRRTGLQTIDAERQLPQAFRQRDGRRVTSAATLVVGLTDVDFASQKGADSQHNRTGAKIQPHLRAHADDALAFNDQIIHALLKQAEARLVFDHAANRRLVQNAIGLGTSGTHRRPLAAVENAELDATPVRRQRHGATEGVDLLYQMPLADTSNGRVATHLADGFDVVGQQQCVRTHARRRKRSLGAGMAATDYNHIEVLRVPHLSPINSMKTLNHSSLCRWKLWKIHSFLKGLGILRRSRPGANFRIYQ